MKKNKNQLNKTESQIKKFKGPCFLCGKVGHRDSRCYQRKGKNAKQEGKSDVQTNLAEGNEVIFVVVFEENLVANKTNWVFDIGTSMNFGSYKVLFYDFLRSSLMESVYIWVTPLLM